MERLTWEEIEAKYPHQLVGLVDIKHVGENTASVESAIVKYTEQDLSYEELLEKAFNDEISLEHTNLEECIIFVR